MTRLLIATLALGLVVSLAAAPAAAQTAYVTSERDDLTLFRFIGWESMPITVGSRAGVLTISHYERLCGIPCSVELSGRGALALSIDGGSPVVVEPPRRGGSLEAVYDDRSGLRTAGWITWLGGVVLGGVIVGTAFLTGPERCYSFGCSRELNVEQLAAGCVVAGVTMIVGMALALLGDGAWLRPGSADRAGRSASEEGDIVSPPAASRGPAPSTWSDLQIRDLLGASHDAVVACFESAREVARIELTLGTAGRVTTGHVLDESATQAETACFQRVLASIAVPAAVDAPRTVTLRFSRSAAEDTAEPDAARATDTPPAGAPSRDVALEVRALLSARAASVLACVAGAAVALDASWTADGALTVHLHGDRAGSGEDGCVVAAFSGARLDPAPGASGTLVHPIAPE